MRRCCLLLIVGIGTLCTWNPPRRHSRELRRSRQTRAVGQSCAAGQIHHFGQASCGTFCARVD